MTECPFFSTEDDKIKCFDECVFYKWEENHGVCPFKNLPDNNTYIIRSYDWDFIEEDEISFREYYGEQF